MSAVREATQQERMTWGDCPVCGATHGNPCRAEFGIPLGTRADGKPPQTGDGVHLVRIQNAPKRVALVAVA